MTAEEFTQRLKGVRQTATGWTALCPAHDDHNASLSISEATDGTVLLKCHAGCTLKAICDAVGIAMKDLFPCRPTGRRKDRGRIVKTYGYTDEAGELLYEVVRLEPKDFRQRRPDSKGGWTWNLNGTPRVLYRLPAVLKAKAHRKAVFVAEGEKDVEALESIGLTATCNPGGAGKWLDSYTDTLAGATVFVLPDKDTPGRKHAALVLEALTGKAQSVRVIELPDRDGHKVKDPADWIQAGGDIDALREVVRQAPETWTPPQSPSAEVQVSPDPLARLRSLKPRVPLDDIGEALRDAVAGLRGKDKLTVRLAREECSQKLKELGINAPVRLVDTAFEAHDAPDAEKREVSEGIRLEDPEPWPDPVDGPELLREIRDTIERYVVLPEQSAIAAALWVLHAHTHEAADISPFLALLSPEKRCGKTTMLQVVGTLSPRRVFASNITPAALFRAVEKYRPTLLIDEGDTFLRDREELRGILNSGHTRTTAYVVRTVGDNHEPTTFKTWCPKIIALIGRLPDTLEDRSIVIPLRRKSPGETVERLRADRLEALDPICRKAWRWGQDALDSLRTHEPETPPELHDRAADNWRPLLAVAEAIGGEWPEHARHAAVSLSCREAGETESRREQLLADIRDIFERRGADRLFSEDIVSDLVEMDGRPWPDFSRGQPLTKTKLARLLKPFGITSRDVRIGTDNAKGYLREDLQDAFSRYLPPSIRDTVTTPVNIDEIAFSIRDTKEACHVLESAKTPVNIDLSRCHVLEGGSPGDSVEMEAGEL